MNKQLKNLSWIFLAGFAGSVIVLWACKFSAIECLECHDHSLSLRALEFRNNAFVGFQHKEVEDVLGSPLQCEECESVTKEDFFWVAFISSRRHAICQNQTGTKSKIPLLFR